MGRGTELGKKELAVAFVLRCAARRFTLPSCIASPGHARWAKGQPTDLSNLEAHTKGSMSVTERHRMLQCHDLWVLQQLAGADAFELFERMPRKNVISWTAIIGGYDQNGESEKALALFRQMWAPAVMKPTPSAFACAVTICANVPDVLVGLQLHSQVAKVGFLSDGFVSTSLVTVYGNCKQAEDSKRLFDEVGYKNVVSWTALVTAYNSSERYEDALKEFCGMVMSGIRPNQSTFTSVLE